MSVLATLLLASSRSIVDLDATVFVQLVLFAVCFFLLRGLVFQPVLRLIDERRAQTEGTRDEAKRLEREAEDKSKKTVRQVQDAKFEASAERERLRMAAKKKEQELLRQARDQAGKILADERLKVAAERAVTEAQLQGEARDLGRRAAEQLAGRPL